MDRVQPQHIRDRGLVEYGELPELTRALRAMGSSRRGGDQQAQFFLPLIESRRRAAQASSPEARVLAFDAVALGRALDRAVERLLAEWPDKRLSARRALRAELGERAGRYSAALTSLAACADEVLASGESARLEAWRAWTRQLQATFDAADEAWMAMRPVVDVLPRRAAP